MKDFKNLIVWDKAHQLVLSVYVITRSFPTRELYGLTSQIRRAAASIPANIAEGWGRQGDAELARFMQIALGSASELEYHLLLAHELNLIEKPKYLDLENQTYQVKKMLISLIKKLRADS